jgi:hypothetical protein
MTVVAYVSGHGLGHAAREVGVLRYLPTEIPLIIKTAAPEWFWRAELPRPFTLISDSFDVGCIQKNGMEIDVPATLTAWREMSERNRERYATEAAFLRENGVRLVVSDVPSLPLVAAARAGIPSICIANFTWADIYQHFAAEYPDFVAIADELTAEYAQASLLLEAGFSLEMGYFPQRESVGIIARTGTDHRDLLLTALPESAQGKRLALVYVGGWGLPIPYERVAAFADWHFLSLDAPPVPPPNWTVISRDLMEHPHLVASVDLAISKPGYGLAGECVAAGTPLLYPPRPQFAEYPALDSVLSGWTGGVRLEAEAFLSVAWESVLSRIPERGSVPAFPATGGAKAGAILRQILERGSD